jgi:hypothetical protein
MDTPVRRLSRCACHPEAAESRAKRATPNEEPALSEAEGTHATPGHHP